MGLWIAVEPRTHISSHLGLVSWMFLYPWWCSHRDASPKPFEQCIVLKTFDSKFTKLESRCEHYESRHIQLTSSRQEETCVLDPTAYYYPKLFVDRMIIGKIIQLSNHTLRSWISEETPNWKTSCIIYAISLNFKHFLSR